MIERSYGLFDIDNTVYKGYVIFDLSKAQADVGLLPRQVLKQLDNDTDLYSQNKIPYENYANRAMRHWAQGLVGESYNQVLTHAQEFLRINRGKFFDFFEVLAGRLADTHDLYLVTAEPEFVCQAISSLFPIAGFASSKFYVGGRFTKAANILATSQDKDSAIDLMLAEYTPVGSIAFGDASSDEGMLERAAYKICINHPKSNLRPIASERGSERGWFVVKPEDVVKQIAQLQLA